MSFWQVDGNLSRISGLEAYLACQLSASLFWLSVVLDSSALQGSHGKMEFHFVFWKKQNLTKSSILSKVPFYPEKLSRLSEKFHFPNFPKFALFFLFLMDFPQISNIFWQNTQIWKVPFCKFRKFFDRKFHFIESSILSRKT